MDEFNEALRVVPELYFLIAKFLSGGPLKETAKVLLKELESVEVLPKRTDWEGNEHTQSYEELASQHRDVAWDRLASVCESALRLARSAAAIAPAPAPASAPANGEASPPAITASSSSDTGTPQPQSSVSERIAARLSLLSDALVRPRPKYASYKQDHSLVRRLVARELGVGNAALLGGRGGMALMSPRMLSGLQLQRRTLGHLSAVYCLVFDCTGRYVVTGADDLLVKVWSAVDGRLLATLRGAGAEITDVCASADGALLAAGSVERLVRVWCLATGAPLAVLSAHAGTITAVHWAPGGGDVRWLASTSTDGSVCFWTSAADGQFLSRPVQYVERTRPGACHMICAAWSAGGGFLAAGSADHHVRIYMVEGAGGPRRVLEAAVHADAVDSVAWAHRGLRLLSGSKDGTAALWTLHATQWRHCSLVPHAHHLAKLKVTMVCWDCSDQFVMTAVSDNTIRVWCASSCTQVSVLRGHRDEAYVLEPHPFLSGVLLSAGHDGQLFVWQATQARPLASYHNHIAGQGDGAIFDAKWGGACTVAASDSHGHLLLLGLGRGPELLRQMPAELFFHTDYRPLVRDALGGALDEQTELPPHLMPPPFLVDVEGAPHPPHMQRLVPGRERLALPQLIPAAAQHARLDRLIQQLAGEREAAEANAIVAAGAALGLGFGMGLGAGPWRGEGVRHTAGSWQRGDPLLVPHCTRPLVPPLPARHAQALQRAAAEMHALEAAWYRREMRRRPLMISTAPAAAPAPRRRAGRPHAPAARPRPRPAPMVRRSEPPEPESASGSDTSDESVRLSGDAHSSPEPEPSSTDGSSSASSQYSDWEAGPPARARRRPLPARRYSPSTVSTKRSERAAGPAASTSTGWEGAGEPGEEGGDDGAASPRPPAELPEQLRVGEWLTAVSPRKAPYHPQMGDECLYFRLGHQRYFEAVAEKDVYKINPRDKPWERTTIHECEVVKVVGIKYVIKPPRVVCLRLSCALPHSRARRSFTVRYHDMADVIDFLVLRQQYEAAAARRWGPRDRFRCMIDDSWWTGVIIERSAPAEGEVPEAAEGAEPLSAAAAFSARAAPHFLSLRVRWDNGEVERLSPWDLEPIDPERLPVEPGGAVPVLPSELEAALYKAEPHEWPPAGNRTAACRAIAQHVGQVMSLSVAEPFVAPVDLARYPLYARVVPYPIDLATVRARFDNLFYRRAAAAQWDVRYLASNAEQFNQAHSPIVRQARLVTDLLLCIISEWRSVDVLAKYRELAAAYHSSDDEPLARTAATKQSSRSGWQDWCARVLRELMASADAEPFKQPVSAAMAPDYSSVVARPMDLGSVTRRLQANEYTQREQFAADVRLVFANSRLYNTNKRSRIYSMTVRLSALFESLWARAPPEPRPRRRRRPTVKLNGSVESHEPLAYASPPSDSSDSETLAATSRRHHATLARDRDSWDSDAPLHTHRKGKGVGKKSKSSTVSAEPAPSSTAATSSATHVSFGASGSGTGRGWASPDPSSGTTSPPHSPPRRRDDDDDDDDARDHDPHRTRGIRRRRGGTSDSGSGDWRTPHHKRPRRHKFKRTRERFSAGTSSASSSSAASAPRRYSSDRSYRPRYSTDDDAPLHLYRQRQGGTNEESTSAGPAPRRKLNGHAAGVSLRARGSPRRYNEQSDSDSCAAISKRSQHRRARDVHLARRRHHARNTAVNEDHNYFNGHVAPAAPAPAPAPAAAPAHAHAHALNGDGSSSSASVPAVSISSRGRVRKLTAKARGLLRE